ncbi:UNVERIFIED_CONTAM: hypothetical protein LK11_39170 [Mumia flava]|nr:aminotransferase class I/II-fold pyridoxal phosphate-dependent enzyme [Mumia flava]
MRAGVAPAAALADGVPDPSARGIAEHVTRLIRTGTIGDGVRLPTVRATAAALHVGPTTVATAWAILHERRLIRSEGRNGTFVRDLSDAPASRAAHRVPIELDLTSDSYDVDLIPDPTAYLARAAAGHPLHLPDAPVVDPDLEALARAAWPFEPASMAVAWSYPDALTQIVDLVASPADRVLVEQACSPETMAVLSTARVRPVHVASDHHGMLPDALAGALSTRAVLAVVQPRMADPLGHALTHQRARELAAVFSRHDAFVVEEDGSAALAEDPSVSVGGHLPHRCILVRGYHRGLGPQARIALVGGPSTIVERIRERQAVTGSFPPSLAQRALRMMAQDPAIGELLGVARARYTHRRRSIVDALRLRGVRAVGGRGLALWVRVGDADATTRRLARAGVLAHSGTALASPDYGRRHVRLAVAGLRDQHDAVAGLLAAA